jgi:hypothetical protein
MHQLNWKCQQGQAPSAGADAIIVQCTLKQHYKTIAGFSRLPTIQQTRKSNHRHPAVYDCRRNWLAAVAVPQGYTYDGRPVCSLKLQGQGSGLECLNRQLISLSNDTLALASGTTVRCFETAQGRPVGQQLSHKLEVKAVSLSQVRNSGSLLH